MRRALNLLVFPYCMFTPFFTLKGYVLSGDIALINKHYYYYHSLKCIVLLVIKSTYTRLFASLFLVHIVSILWAMVSARSKGRQQMNKNGYF